MLASVMAVKTKKPQEWGCASYFLLAEGIRLRVSFLYFTLFRLLALCEVMGGTPLAAVSGGSRRICCYYWLSAVCGENS